MMMTWALQPWMDQHDQPTATLESSKFVLQVILRWYCFSCSCWGLVSCQVELLGWVTKPWGTVSHIPGSNQAGTFESMSFPNLPNLLGIWICSVEGYLLKIFFPSKPSFAEERCHHLPLRGNPWCRLRHPLPFKALTALLPELSVTSTEEGLVLWILRSWLIPGFQLLSIKEYQKHLISTNSRHEHDFFLDVFFLKKKPGCLPRSIQSTPALFGVFKNCYHVWILEDPRWIRRRQHRWSQCQLGPMKVGFRLERSVDPKQKTPWKLRGQPKKCRRKKQHKRELVLLMTCWFLKPTDYIPPQKN